MRSLALLLLAATGTLWGAPEAGESAWAWGDFDGDQVIDRVEVHAQGGVRLSSGAGIGKLKLMPITVLSAVDVDHDNDLDLVLWHRFGTGNRKVWVNDGAGRFERQDTPESHSRISHRHVTKKPSKARWVAVASITARTTDAGTPEALPALAADAFLALVDAARIVQPLAGTIHHAAARGPPQHS